jgi:D-amino peptidase
MWLNGRLAGEIGIDAGIVSDYGLPVIMVSGDDKACSEAADWIPGVVTCQVKEGLSRESARATPLPKAHALIRAKTIEAIGRIGAIRPMEVSRPVTIRKQMYEKIQLPKPEVRPDVRRIDERTAEATSETVEKAFLWH